MMDPSVVRFLAVKSTRCSGGYMAKDSSSNFSGKCKGWPRGKAAGVAKMERLTSPFIIPFLAFKFAENPDAMGYMGRVPCQSRIVVSGSNILMVVWPNGDMVRVPPKRNTCGRIYSVIPCLLSPFLPVLFFFFWLLGQLDEGRTELLGYSLRHPMSSRSKTKYCLARFLARAPSRWLLGMPKPSRLFLSQSEPTRGICFREVICVTSARPKKGFVNRQTIVYIHGIFIIYTREANRVRHQIHLECAG